MRKLITKLLITCLVISLIPLSAFADYTIPDYAVKLNADRTEIYEGENVVISFNINNDDFLMTDMSVDYDTAYFTYENNTSGINDALNGVVEFRTPEIKGAQGAASDGKGGYNLATKFTFTAKEVTDTIEVDFNIAAADIVYNYESAREDADTNVSDRTGTSVIIVKQYEVSFVDEDGSTLIGEAQKVDKGLGDDPDTALTAPAVDYEDYVKSGLVADYYEHVWKYNGNEYTDEEIAAFGQTGSANEIIADTTFVLEVREQTFNVTVPAESFDTAVTSDEATYGTDYTGKINPDEYDPKYDYTVKYVIDGNEQEVECVGDSFTIPGENIIGNMELSYEKELNITITAYAEYVTGYFLITVDGAADGYTFNNNEMYKSENHHNLRAWIYKPDTTGLSEAAVEEIVEEYIFTSNTGSPSAPASYDINNSQGVDMNDAALVHGAYKGALSSDWVLEYLMADVDQSYKVNTHDYDMVVEEYKS